MSADFSKAYELLGVKPGVSSTELKSAHRDLAKVWHPDRFLHDPRLQEKAQEKLKEINEAYELLSSGKTPRPANVPPPSRPEPVRYTAAASSTPRATSNWRWIAIPLFIFVAVFSITIRALLNRRLPPVVQDESAAQVETPANTERATSSEANARARVSDTSARSNEQSAAPDVTSTQTQPAENTAAVATVTVLIDPESGLLARSDCPLRSRMTYPSGSAPTGHCNINHAPAPPKESRIKSFAKRVGRSLDQANP